MALVTVSVVSHRQNALVNQLLADLGRHATVPLAVVVTVNTADPTPLEDPDAAFPVEVVRNPAVKGFGANHNSAFERCRSEYFCVANPDIRLAGDPFPALLQSLAAPLAGIAGPLVRTPSGEVEDSARRFPTAASLLRKLAGAGGGPEYPWDHGQIEVDWVAGMFMAFRSDAFREVRGFDEGYFLYYEDVDICRRLRASGRRTHYQPAAEVVHDAQRASRRDMRHLRWHLQSMLRFLTRA